MRLLRPSATTLLVCLLVMSWANAQEIRRATADFDDSTVPWCAGTFVSKPANSLSGMWDATGNSTSSVLWVEGINPSTLNRRSAHSLANWPAPSGNYLSVSLKIESSCQLSGAGGGCAVSYTTNNGTSWTMVRSSTMPWGRVVDTIPITLPPGSQALAAFKVGVCTYGKSSKTLGVDPGIAQLQVWDVRTEGFLAVPPIAPTNLSVSGTANGLSSSLSWSDASVDETGFTVERCEVGAGCSYSPVANLAANQNSWSDTTSTCKTYRYRVYAKNTYGNSGYSNVVQLDTACQPASPTNFNSTASADGLAVVLNWTDNSDNEHGFRIARCVGSGCEDWNFSRTAPANTGSYSDTTSPCTTYRYAIDSFNNDVGSWGYSGHHERPTPCVPATPAIAVTPSADGRGMTISWGNLSNETAYYLERCIGASCVTGFVPVGGALPADTTSYSDSGLNPGATYGYRLRAINAVGYSGYSPIQYAIEPSAPSTPVITTATPASSGTSVTIVWSNVEGETSYALQRCLGVDCGSGFGSVGGTFAQDTTTYTDTGLTPGTTYGYRVHALNAVGPSAWSATKYSIQPDRPQSPTLTVAAGSDGKTMSITWNDVATQTAFYLERCTGANCTTGFTLIGNGLAATTLAFSDSGLQPGGTYGYRIRAYNEVGYSSWSAIVYETEPVPPAAPSELVAQAVAGSQSISLQWTDASNNETGFRVQRCVTSQCSSFVALPAWVAANSQQFLDSGLLASTSYTYRVIAYNEVGESSPSGTVTATTGASGSLSETSGGLVTTYEYDGANNLVRVEQRGTATSSADYRVRTFAYDSLSQLREATNPESGTIKYEYDNDGNLSTRQDDRTSGDAITYCYDPLHRLVGKKYAWRAGCGDYDVTYIYDDPNGFAAGATYPVGHRTKMTDPSGETEWAYDAAGRVIEEKRTIAGVTKSIKYAYNFDDSVDTLTYPTGRVVSYTYDNAGRAVKAYSDGIAFAEQATYVPSGALESVRHGGAITVTNSHNNRLQPITLSAATPTNTVMSFTYDFGIGQRNNGNVIRIINNMEEDRTQNFAYDDLNRIAAAWTDGPIWGGRYKIDAWGNLTNIDCYPGRNACEPLNQPANALNRIGPNYDLAGNLELAGGYSFQYDAENRLTHVGGSLAYIYDGDGKRVKKVSGKLYWTGTAPDALVETDLSGGNSSEYIFFNGKRIARVAGGLVYYYFADHLGTSRVMTTATGTVCYDADFYPYGREQHTYLDNCSPSYKFTGKERDSATENGGLDYFGARYYGSTMGRFISPDEFTGGPVDAFSSNDPGPTGPLPYADVTDPQSLNKYSYTYNNPLKYTDPDGHCPSCAILLEQAVERAAPLLQRYGPTIVKGLQLGAAAVWSAVGASVTSSDDRGMGGPSRTFDSYSKSQQASSSQSSQASPQGQSTPNQPDGPSSQGPKKAKDAPGVSSSGQATDVHGNKLGGSGRPQQHSTESNTREGARNKALNQGATAVNHPNPKDGRPHFHSGDGQSSKKPNSTHHNYPER